MKTYQDHDTVLDQGKATPKSKRPNQVPVPASRSKWIRQLPCQPKGKRSAKYAGGSLPQGDFFNWCCAYDRLIKKQRTKEALKREAWNKATYDENLRRLNARRAAFGAEPMTELP